MDAVVIGGGITGVASAYYLRDREVDVTLLEKSSLGAGSTDRANGGIRAQFSSPVSVALSRESMAVWERFDELFGTDIGYRRPGYMFLLRSESMAELFRENVDMQNELGVPSEMLSPQEATAYCPELHAENYVAATYSPTDGFADPHLGLQGYAEAARTSGVDIRTNVEVTDVELDGGSGGSAVVTTTDGEFETEYVINAAGVWAPRIGEMVGVDLPISPRRRQLMVVVPEIPVPKDVPLTIDVEANVHFRPERAGSAVVGGHFDAEDPEMDPDNYPERVSLEWSATVIERAAECAGYFGQGATVKNAWAGLYAVTPDHHPIIDEPRPGFVTAAGFSGHGFMQAPAVGQIVAEMAVEGEASLVDVSMLTATRFDSGMHLQEGTVID